MRSDQRPLKTRFLEGDQRDTMMATHAMASVIGIVPKVSHSCFMMPLPIAYILGTAGVP